MKLRHLRGGCTGESDGGCVDGWKCREQPEGRTLTLLCHTHIHRTTRKKTKKEETLRRLSRERGWGQRRKRRASGRHAFVGAVGTRSTENYGRNINTKNERTKNDQKTFRTASEGRIKMGNKNSTAAQREVVETTLKCYTYTAIFVAAYVRVLLLPAHWIFLAVRVLGLPRNGVYICMYVCMYKREKASERQRGGDTESRRHARRARDVGRRRRKLSAREEAESRTASDSVFFRKTPKRMESERRGARGDAQWGTYKKQTSERAQPEKHEKGRIKRNPRTRTRSNEARRKEGEGRAGVAGNTVEGEELSKTAGTTEQEHQSV